MSLSLNKFKGKILLVPAMTLALSLFTVGNNYAGGNNNHGHKDHDNGHAAPHWSYEGEGGPSQWGSLSEDFAVCSEGKGQSPIDITGAASAKLAPIVFNYKNSGLNILNNGHTIQANYDEGSSIKVDGKEFKLLQFHFHGLSEHTINGKHSALEMHLVHKSKDGKLAVVGVMINEGAHNAAYDNIWANLPDEAGETEKKGSVHIKAADLLPKSKGYYTYTGSLTTPPCSEGVTWLVLKNPIEMSKDQIASFGSIIEGNYRPVQPLHGRSLKVSN